MEACPKCSWASVAAPDSSPPAPELLHDSFAAAVVYGTAIRLARVWAARLGVTGDRLAEYAAAMPSMGSLRNQIRTLASTAPGRFQTNRLAGPFPNEEDANGKLPRLFRTRLVCHA